MLNQLNIIGRVTIEPTIRTINTANGQIDVCNINVAVNEYYRGKDKTTFFRVSLWGNLATRAMKILKIGSLVHIVGRVRVSQYINANSEVKYSLEVSASDFDVLYTSKGNNRQTTSDYNTIKTNTKNHQVQSMTTPQEETIDLDKQNIKESATTTNYNFRDQIENIVKNNEATKIASMGTNKYHADNETFNEPTNQTNIISDEDDYE